MSEQDHFAAMRALEEEIFQMLAGSSTEPTSVFLVGSPRTGSTLTYQGFAAAFGLPPITNLTNDRFGATPIVGFSIQKSFPTQIGFKSSFGKTSGPMQPSEGSAVLRQWFGGGHPSQTVSTGIKEGAEPHMRKTLLAVERLFEAPLVIKNPWNCFRIADIAARFPAARFVWVRRDVADAAKSDLEARYVTKGTAQSWNSATPSNYEELMKRPPFEQVVENQYEFNRAIGGALTRHAAGRHTEFWYEDFVADPAGTLRRSGARIGLELKAGALDFRPHQARERSLGRQEAAEIDAFISRNLNRFSFMRYGQAD